MPEFFIVTKSFAAPFISDTGEHYVDAATPRDALETVRGHYDHPAGLYFAGAWASHKAYSTGQPWLAAWLCNAERKKGEVTKALGSYSFLGHRPDHFEVDGTHYYVDDPKDGAYV